MHQNDVDDVLASRSTSCNEHTRLIQPRRPSPTTVVQVGCLGLLVQTNHSKDLGNKINDVEKKIDALKNSVDSIKNNVHFLTFGVPDKTKPLLARIKDLNNKDLEYTLESKRLELHVIGLMRKIEVGFNADRAERKKDREAKTAQRAEHRKELEAILEADRAEHKKEREADRAECKKDREAETAQRAEHKKELEAILEADRAEHKKELEAILEADRAERKKELEAILEADRAERKKELDAMLENILGAVNASNVFKSMGNKKNA
jgi:hypothetical protein